MRHLVVEGAAIREWLGQEWRRVPWSRVEAAWPGEAYVWTSRKAAEACRFVPPSAVERPAVTSIVFEKEPSVVMPGMERVIAYQWDGSEWKPILAATAHAMVGRGEAYRWPDRVTAGRAGFVPPADEVFESGKWVQADLGKQWADTSAEVAGGWVAVADRLPTERTTCMVTDGEEIVCRVWIPGLKEWMEMESAEYLAVEDAEITHWWPCPPLPR